jgi:hypothetical protein
MLGTLSCLLLRKSKVKGTLQKSCTPAAASLKASCTAIAIPLPSQAKTRTPVHHSQPEYSRSSEPFANQKPKANQSSALERKEGIQNPNASNEVVIFIVP